MSLNGENHASTLTQRKEKSFLQINGKNILGKAMNQIFIIDSSKIFKYGFRYGYIKNNGDKTK